MRINYWITLIFVSIIYFSNAQNSVQEYVDEGVELHDKGEFEAAIKQYKKALKISQDDPLANYEIASTYYAMGQNGKAIKHADVVIVAKAEFMEPAYILKGSALDSEKNTKEALEEKITSPSPSESPSFGARRGAKPRQSREPRQKREKEKEGPMGQRPKWFFSSA